MKLKSILWDQRDPYVVLHISRAAQLNALNAEIFQEIRIAVQQFRQNEDLHGAIITGAGSKAFAAGADIKELEGMSVDNAESLSQRGQEIFDLIESSPKPIIAAINGFALGGGLELAMACHIRIAGEQARMGLPEVKLGLIPGYGGTVRLPELVGSGIATEMLTTGQMIGAHKALLIGLVSKNVAPGMEVDAAIELLGKITANGPGAIGKILKNRASNVNRKELFKQESHLFGECFGSVEAKEGISAFLEKRKPNFRGT